MSKQYINIALPLPIYREFTYSFGENIEASNILGCRVLVPFGKQILCGIAVGTADFPEGEVRDIIERIDNQPIFSASMLDFTRWAAQYYLCSWGETLHAAIPAGLSPHQVIRIHLLRDVKEAEFEVMQRRAPKRAALLQILLKHSGDLSVQYLQKAMKSSPIAQQLEALETEGIISINRSVEQDTVIKFQLGVLLSETLSGNSEIFRGILDELDRKQPRQALTLSHVYLHQRHSKEPILKSILKKDLSIADSVIKSLIQKEYLTEHNVEISRIDDHPETSLARLNEVSALLTAEQLHALQKINDPISENVHKVFLLHGITGSGKTLVYIHAVRHCLALGKNALILVPEVTLTPQLIDRFRQYFGDNMAVMHSRMPAGERFEHWRKILSGNANIVIGARSAIFAPLENLGIIIIDEEHDSSYKQESPAPRYNARDCAVVRGIKQHATVVLGSATPSMESMFNAQTGKYHLLEITERADGAKLPEIQLINLTEQKKMRQIFGLFSKELLDAIIDRLYNKEGIILLHNRRGFSSRLECTDCSWTPECKNCSVATTYHKHTGLLRCHYCGYSAEPPRICQRCGGMEIENPGAGTQRIEDELSELLKIRGMEPTIQRMDLDSTSKRGAHRKMLENFSSGKTDILIGTQMVSKGLDIHRVTLVGVINADITLALPDFRASEKTFQLLTQVAGRAGRSSEKRGMVIIQTHRPEHQTMLAAAAGKYEHFYADELQMRKTSLYPPYTRFILIEFTGPDELKVHEHAHRFAGLLPSRSPAAIRLGPTSPSIARLRNNYRRIIVLKNIKSYDPAGDQLRGILRHALSAYQQKYAVKNVRISIDVDSYSSV